MRGRRKLADADFPAQVAELEAARLAGYAPIVAALVEIDGERAFAVGPASRGELLPEHLAALGDAGAHVARAFALGCRASLRVDLRGFGRMRALCGSRSWSSHHYGLWVALTTTRRSPVIRRYLSESIARVDEYRAILPSMRPTEDAVEAVARRSLRRPRDLPMPYRAPTTPRRGDEIRAPRAPATANDAGYATFEEWFAALDHDDDGG